jgi:hypothetical protein
MTTTRRSALALAATAPAAGLALPGLGETDSAMVGVLIRIAWLPEGWHVLVPEVSAMAGRFYAPGMAIPYKWIKLSEYLSEAEKEFDLTPVST